MRKLLLIICLLLLSIPAYGQPIESVLWYDADSICHNPYSILFDDDNISCSAGVITVTDADSGAGSGDLLADGSVPMTANWDIGNFDITLKALTGDGTIEGATITEGGVAVLNTGEYHAGTDPTADLEEEVTEGSLADSTIVSADIKNGTIVVADTAITAGRSLTWSNDNLLADEETYIYKAKIAFEDPVATDDFVFGELTHAVTFTSIYCKTLVGTVTLDVTSGGTDIEGTDIVCDTDGQSDAGISNASGSASDEIKLAITEVASAPTYLFLQLNGTQDD